MKNSHLNISLSKLIPYLCINKKQLNMSQQTRPLYEIAREIKKDWQKVYFGAVPYLDAMLTLNKVSDNFYEDSGKSIVLYFLSNASSYRGENAKRIKKELKELCK